MPTGKTKLRILRLLCLVSTISALPASAQELARFDFSVAGFEDHAAPGRVLLISQDGRASWLSGARIERTAAYRIADPACVPTTQNTVPMGGGVGGGVGGGGLTLAYPFLVGVERACYIDEQSGAIRLLSDYRANLPRNPYSVTYAGADRDAAYFLINGRPYPDGSEGYLLLLRIDRATLQVSGRPFLSGVPGYSGAMLTDQGGVWLTAWPGQVYNIPFPVLHGLIQAGGVVPFLEHAREVFHDLDGMSLFLLRNDRSLLYFNGEYESYTVSLADGGRAVASPPCPPVSGTGGDWIVLCNGNTVEIWRERGR